MKNEKSVLAKYVFFKLTKSCPREIIR